MFVYLISYIYLSIAIGIGIAFFNAHHLLTYLSTYHLPLFSRSILKVIYIFIQSLTSIPPSHKNPDFDIDVLAG